MQCYIQCGLTASLNLSLSLEFRYSISKCCAQITITNVYTLYKQKLQTCEDSTLLVPESPSNHRAYVKCINTSGNIILPSLKEMNITHS